ncbi:MAG: phenylalanine--tRNA ligase subunit alpha [Candidatus Aenigmatarchaeota archaeon]
MYALTPEGKEYLEHGLPERNLMNILKKPMSFEEAKKRVDNFNIALSHAKKNGWVKIDAGKIVLVSVPIHIPEEDGLFYIKEKKKLPEKLENALIKRKLLQPSKGGITKILENQIGKEVTQLTPELIKSGAWKKTKIKSYNVAATGKKIYAGKRHPYNTFLSEVKRKLVELGFIEMDGNHIETEFWNFDALFQAQNHPSRDWTQTYSLKNPTQGSLPNPKIVASVKAAHENGGKTGSTGWGYTWDPKKAARLMPRAHTTACSARQLAKGPEIPGKYFAISRCFRPDVIDATHGVEFNQVEGIIVDPSLNFKNLLGILKMFAIEIAGADKVKFFPDYYPFTEPSVQMSAKHPILGWVELGGAGMFRPELNLPLGVKDPVMAWGLGIDRLAMYKLGIKDIRQLFSQDIDWLRRQRV